MKTTSAVQFPTANLTTAEVCALLRCSTKTLQRYRKSRVLSFIRRNGRFLFPAAAVQRYLDARTVKAAA